MITVDTSVAQTYAGLVTWYFFQCVKWNLLEVATLRSILSISPSYSVNPLMDPSYFQEANENNFTWCKDMTYSNNTKIIKWRDLQGTLKNIIHNCFDWRVEIMRFVLLQKNN
jgi:hypothetical protein